VSEELGRAAKIMARQLDDARSCRVLEKLRGIEGEAANTYFGVFDRMIQSEGQDFRFRGRSRRPPLDPIKSQLSFLYSVL
jgi:CRISPR-associated protein Cas1